MSSKRKTRDREILPTGVLFPVRYLLVENVLYHEQGSACILAFVQSQHVPFFNHLAIEQPESLRKQEKHDQQDCGMLVQKRASQVRIHLLLFSQKCFTTIRFLLVFCSQKATPCIKEV